MSKAIEEWGPAMTEPPPSAEALEAAKVLQWDTPLTRYDIAYALDRFAERVCEQRVSAETERCARLLEAHAEGHRKSIEGGGATTPAKLNHEDRQLHSWAIDILQEEAERIRAPAERPAPEGPPAIETHTCPKCGAQGAMFICSEPGCPVNGGAAYGPAPDGPQPIPREVMARVLDENLGGPPLQDPPSPPAVVDYTELARERADGSIHVTLSKLPGFHFILASGEGVGALLAALDQHMELHLSAVASEHEAEIEALNHDIERHQAIASSEAERHSEALAERDAARADALAADASSAGYLLDMEEAKAALLARLREPEMREAVKAALVPYLHDAITIQARDDAADAVLAVITRETQR